MAEMDVVVVVVASFLVCLDLSAPREREKEIGECVRMHKFEHRKLVCCARRILDVVVIKYSH